MNSERLRKAIRESNYYELDEIFEEAVREKQLSQESISTTLSYVAEVGDAEVLKYLSKIDPLANAPLPEDFFPTLICNRQVKKRASLIKYFFENPAKLNHGIQKMHLLAASGNARILENYNFQEEYIAPENYGYTPLHYALLSGFDFSKDPKILEKALEHEKHIIQSGINAGASFTTLLGSCGALQTLESWLQFVPQHSFEIKTCFQNEHATFCDVSIIWYLAFHKKWDLVRALLKRNQTDIVELWMYPKQPRIAKQIPLNTFMIEAHQWDILADCLLRDESQSIPLDKMIGNEKLFDLLKRCQQLKLLKILEERQGKNRERDQSKLKLACSKKLQTLIASNAITLQQLDQLIKLGADPNFEYPSNIKNAFKNNRIDIVKHLITEYHVKLVNNKVDYACIESRDVDYDILRIMMMAIPKIVAEFCHWLLENDRYQEVTENISVAHIKALVGEFDSKFEEYVHWPTDAYGLTPYHYMWLCGISNAQDPIKALKHLRQFPIACDPIMKGWFQGANLPVILCELNMDLLDRILKLDPDRKYDLKAATTTGITALYSLAVKEKWQLYLDLWRRNPQEALLEVEPNELYQGDRIKLSLILAEKNINIFISMLEENTKQRVNIEESFPATHKNAGITLAWLFAFQKKWTTLEFLLDNHIQFLQENHLPVCVNLNAKPVDRDNQYGNYSMRQLLKMHKQDKLLAKMEKYKKLQDKTKKLKPVNSNAPVPIFVVSETKTLTRAQQIEAALKKWLTDTCLAASYHQEGKKTIIRLHYHLDTPLTAEQKSEFQLQKKAMMTKLVNAKNLKGNEGISVNVGDATLSASSEGAMFSFFNNAKVKAELSNAKKEMSVSSSDNFKDGTDTVSLTLTEAQQQRWQRALMPGFCDALTPTDIVWDAEMRCFVISLRAEVWHVRDYKSGHQDYERYEITESFIREKIVSQIEIFLLGTKSKDRSVFAKVTYQDNCLFIVPYVEEIPLLTEVQQSLYKKIRKKCHKLDPIPVPPALPLVKKQSFGGKAESTKDATKPTFVVVDTSFEVRPDNIQELLKKIAVDFEFNFLYEKNRIYKGDQCRKIIFSYNYQGALYVQGQLSLHLILALGQAFHEVIPGFMNVYRHRHIVTVSFKFNKAFSLSRQQLTTLTAGFSEQMSPFLQNPLKLKQRDPEDEKDLLQHVLKAIPQKNKKNKKAKPERSETEADVFSSLQALIQHLTTAKQNNIHYHLNHAKQLKRPLPLAAMNYAYLLHAMRTVGMLAGNDIEGGIFYKFRNIIRHAVDDTKPTTGCDNFCDKVEPLMQLLKQYFAEASISHVSVCLFAPQKSIALEELRMVVGQFEEALNSRALSDAKDHQACLDHYRAMLAEIHTDGIPAQDHPDYTWKRDATLMLCSLIEEITGDGTYNKIYRFIGHKFKLPYESFANDLYVSCTTQLNSMQLAIKGPALSL